ncbi:LysR family transcriptional regulator [Dactylosporangium sp. CS-033363]|uniref:LysR family transcriptional regulator n=1 Tax=Dactylosporangium sp. CS-033363 TaxID=3239935 RepID=UPI003D8E7534
MELRDIEIFLTLAEELHFGRTAERLHLTSARVSQAIQKQERAIGARLFERTSRVVLLTAAGERLRDDLLPAHRDLSEAIERAKLHARGKHHVLRVGLIPANVRELRPYFDAFTARHPHCELRLRHNPFVDAFGPLRRGEIDVLVSWLPVEEHDLTVGPVIFTESRVLAVAADHALLGAVSMEALGDHRYATDPHQPEYWQDSFLPFRTPRGRPLTRAGAVTTMDELNTLIGTGNSAALLGRHAARYYARPDISYVPVSDAPTLRWGLVWRRDAETAPLRDFAQTVQAIGPRPL